MHIIDIYGRIIFNKPEVGNKGFVMYHGLTNISSFQVFLDFSGCYFEISTRTTDPDIIAKNYSNAMDEYILYYMSFEKDGEEFWYHHLNDFFVEKIPITKISDKTLLKIEKISDRLAKRFD